MTSWSSSTHTEADVTKFAVYVVLVEDTNEAFEALSETYPEQFDPIDQDLDQANAEDLYQQAKDLAYR